LDVAAALDAKGQQDVAYAGGIVHLDRGGNCLLFIGVDDGVAAMVDGRSVFTRDQARSRRDDEDLVPLDLAAGDHVVVLSLRRHGRPWGLRARLVDAALRPPDGAWWQLPGAHEGDPRALAARMSRVSFDRGMGTNEYRPTLTLHFFEGAPRDVPIAVRAELVRSVPRGGDEPLLRVDGEGELGNGVDADGRIISLGEVSAAAVEDDDWTLNVDVAGRALELRFHPRRTVREATVRAQRAIDVARGREWLTPASIDSVEFLTERLVGFVAKGDGDLEAQLADARELSELASAIEQERDPYVGSLATGSSGRTWRTGAMRRAYRSPADGHFSEFAAYVPPDFDPRRTYPLIVALHGLNGYPMQMLMWVFGHDDPDRESPWEDRHPRRDLETLRSIVVAPDGHFNAFYRDLGEDDVMRVVDWAMATYPVDPARVTVTGPSMGGIGAAACALHHPDRFAAAEPLCGYHSYFVRTDVAGRALRPWERFLAEQGSNVFWAENGQNLPLYIVHGTKDLPEENSGVLIDRYEELHYDIEHEHPALGHNVWQTTYEDLKGARWLLSHRRPMHPRAVRFKTSRTRWADDAWVHVRELASSDAWGELSARIDGKSNISVTTHGVAAFGLDRDSVRIDDAAPVVVNADGNPLTFQAGDPIELHRNGQGLPWQAGAAVHGRPFKHGTITGPIRDVFHEPVLLVWGASDPAQARANEEVARDWGRVHWGVRVEYPVMSDIAFFDQGQPIANDHALFLVGNAKSNLIVRELEPDFPIRIDGENVVVGTDRIAPKKSEAVGFSQLGVVFVLPNPRRPDRYVVVVEGVGPLGTWRSTSLPELLPDYVVYDEDVAPARGQLLLGAASLRAAGFFDQDWGMAGGDTMRLGTP
jgi:poly(3-hydroxybutyrate) depolymerase